MLQGRGWRKCFVFKNGLFWSFLFNINKALKMIICTYLDSITSKLSSQLKPKISVKYQKAFTSFKENAKYFFYHSIIFIVGIQNFLKTLRYLETFPKNIFFFTKSFFTLHKSGIFRRKTIDSKFLKNHQNEFPFENVFFKQIW